MTKSLIADNLKRVRADIARFEKQYGRAENSVKLLAVSKQQSAFAIMEAVAAGQWAFGENYLQEALTKMAATDPRIEWHFIGALQRNKTRSIAAHFSWVHTIADRNIAQRLHEQRASHLPPLNICLQINIDNEPTKAGIALDDAFALANDCQSFSRLCVRGLMAIPAPKKNHEQIRNAYHRLFQTWQLLKNNISTVDTLSIGMSDDMEDAIACGGTLVRIGTNIFGKRPLN